MDVIYILLPIVLLIVVAALIAFFWAIRSGQFDDLNTPALRVLFDDDKSPPPQKQ